MYKVRLWSVRHAGLLEKVYNAVEVCLVRLTPLFERIGYDRLEKPVALLEKSVKSVLFDCQMCGQCALSSTGMSCPMNCPKTMRNGPCGGVRENGHCEVKPEMRCVWVEAVNGHALMQSGNNLSEVQFPVDYTLKGSSSWLRVAREKAAEAAAQNTDSGSVTDGA